MANTVAGRARPAVSRAVVPKRRSVPEDESADPVGPVPSPAKHRPGTERKRGAPKLTAASAQQAAPTALAQQKADFTAEGAPPPVQPGTVAQPFAPD